MSTQATSFTASRAAPAGLGQPGSTTHAPSYYAASGLSQPDRPALKGTTQADVCIIGAGYTGLSSALHLAEQGYKVVVLEAARVGWGASGRNGGQLVHSYSRDIDVIEARYGKAAATALGSMAFEGARIIKERIARYQIDCHFRPGGMFTALSDKQVRQLEHHKALWERYGHTELDMLDARATEQAVGTRRYKAALLDHSTGHVHPCAWHRAKPRPSSRSVASSMSCRPSPGSNGVSAPRCTPPTARSRPGS